MSSEYQVSLDAALEALRLVQRHLTAARKSQVIRIIEPSQWVSTEKAILNMHKHNENCVVGDGDDTVQEICEVTEEELHQAYLRAANWLGGIRFMMGVPGALGHHEGIEPYEEAKARADERRARLKSS